MGKRGEYPQMRNVDVCECGSEDIKCINSRSEDGIRFRTKECLWCGKRFNTREVDEEEWRNLLGFKKKIENIMAEIK